MAPPRPPSHRPRHPPPAEGRAGLALAGAAAIERIAKHGHARSPELAKAMGTTQGRAETALAPLVKAGELVTCRVKRSGQPECIEYRLSGLTPTVDFGHLSEQYHRSAEAGRYGRRPDPKKGENDV